MNPRSRKWANRLPILGSLIAAAAALCLVALDAQYSLAHYRHDDMGEFIGWMIGGGLLGVVVGSLLGYGLGLMAFNILTRAPKPPQP